MSLNILSKMQTCTTVILYSFFLVSISNADQNVALHKRCSFTHKPNYELTEDPSDDKSLTDGVIDKSSWYSEYRKKTVGWAFKYSIEIVVDLEKEYNISFINLYTTGGGQSGVMYPEYVVALASSDGKNYAPVSITDTSGWNIENGNSADAKIIKLELRQRCRYVKLFIRPTSTTFFSDEIEIIAAEESYERSHVFFHDNEISDYAERIRELDRAIKSLNDAINSCGINETVFLNKVLSCESDFNRLKLQLSQIEKIDQIEELVRLLRADFLKLKTGTSWFFECGDEIIPLRASYIPLTCNTDSEIYLYLWRNEYATAVINLTNCSSENILFNVNIAPLHNGEAQTDSTDYFSVRRGLYINQKNTGLFVDPLVLQNGKPFTVKPGETIPLHIIFNSKDLSQGVYRSAIAVSSSASSIEKKNQILSLKIEIADKSYPEKSKFYAYNWDYITDKNIFTSVNPQAAAENLASFHTNVTVIPQYKVFELKGADVKISSNLGRELKLRSYAQKRLIFLSLKSRYSYFGETIASEQWQRSFASFIQKLVAYLQSEGFNYEEFALYPYDEYIGDDFIKVAQYIREIDPNIKIFANSLGKEKDDVHKAKGLIDIWCVPLNVVRKDTKVLDIIKQNCKIIWSYETEPMQNYIIGKDDSFKELYHRTMPIATAALGLCGAGFWVYADWDGGDFNPKDKLVYGVIYDGRKCSDRECISEFIVPSKRWLQWREGVEDAIALMECPDLLDEFLNKSDEGLTSKYLVSLRKKADRN